jgi:signal transduction histidine kinase
MAVQRWVWMARDVLDDVREQRDRLLRSQRVLFDVAGKLGPALELQPVLEIALQAMQDVVDDVKGGSIVLLEGDQLRIAACKPAVSEEVMDLRLPIGSGLSGKVVRSRRPYRTGNLREDPHVDLDVAATGSNATIVSWLGVPLMVLGECIGLLQVDSARRDAFDDADEATMAGLGLLVAGAIESARQYHAIVELEQLKSGFLERVSHELRTPVTILQGFASTLRARGHELDEASRATMIDRMGAAARRMGYLVEEMLMMTSLAAGVTGPRPQLIDLDAVLAETARSVDAVGVLDLPERTGLTLTCDPLLLRQVLAPIFDNAVKYATSGTVTVGIDGDAVTITVTDAGPGIDPHLREHLFDRFVRGGHTNAGMGLGLSISRHVAASLRATVEECPADEGACFRVRLPIG